MRAMRNEREALEASFFSFEAPNGFYSDIRMFVEQMPVFVTRLSSTRAGAWHVVGAQYNAME